MNMISYIPDAIFLEILSYVENTDQVEFAGVNKYLCFRLIKKLRTIRTQSFDVQLQAFFEDPSKREKLLALIENPYFQFEGNQIDTRQGEVGTWGKVNSVPTSFNFSFALLNMSILDFTLCLSIYTINDVHTLSLSFPMDFGDISVFRDERMPRIKQLKLAGGQATEIPVIPKLKSLRCNAMSKLTSEWLRGFIPASSHLTSVSLNSCHTISDVSCLDQIWDLKLESCHAITDISCLNHNHKIQISFCHKIQDYTKSFEHSIEIDVRIYHPRKIDISRFAKAKKIFLYGEFDIALENSMLKFPSSSNLTSFTIGNQSLLFMFPEHHHLRELTIVACHKLINFNNIRNVKVLTHECLSRKISMHHS